MHVVATTPRGVEAEQLVRPLALTQKSTATPVSDILGYLETVLEMPEHNILPRSKLSNVAAKMLQIAWTTNML